MHQSMLRIVLVMMITATSLIALMAQDNGEDGVPTEVDATEVSTEFADDHTEDVPYWIVLVSVAGAGIIVGTSRVFFRDRYSWLQYGIVGTIAVTGIIHLIFGVLGDNLLALNGVGYLILAGIRFVPRANMRPFDALLAIVIIIYTTITIIGYFLSHAITDPIGGFTKAVEILLIILVITNLLRRPEPITRQ